jgi:hypothetical protein
MAWTAIEDKGRLKWSKIVQYNDIGILYLQTERSQVVLLG